MSSSAPHRTVVPFPQAAQPSVDGNSELRTLIEAARLDDTRAWSVLYERYYFQIFRHVCAMTGSSGLAEDLTQETFARAMVALPGYRNESSFSTWLHGIAVNLVRMHWRKERRRDRAQSQLDLVAAAKELLREDLEREHIRRRRMMVLYNLLEELTESMREAFVLRYVRGLSAQEAGAQLGVEAGTVRVRAHRAKERLEQQLQQLGWTVIEGQGG